MLGYECPCCGGTICQTKPNEMRDCPTCGASVNTQAIVIARRRAATTQIAERSGIAHTEGDMI
jgi:uncharacterized Zn finger protein (UPF0148 family)